MLDAIGDFGRGDVLSRGLKEVHRGPIFERRRVGHVDDNFGTCKRLRQAFALTVLTPVLGAAAIAS
jgi:hypothetical protein